MHHMYGTVLIRNALKIYNIHFSRRQGRMDDIYEVCREEGTYLAGEIDKLRQKRNKGKINIKNNNRNIQVESFRRNFLLASGLKQVFIQAKTFFMTVGTDEMLLTLVYDRCHIIYHLRPDSDWKIIEVTIADISECADIRSNQQKLGGRIETAIFLVLARLSHTYGFSKVFKCGPPDYIKTIFTTILQNRDIKETDFGLELKVTDIIRRNYLRREFMDNYSSPYILHTKRI